MTALVGSCFFSFSPKQYLGRDGETQVKLDQVDLFNTGDLGLVVLRHPLCEQD